MAPAILLAVKLKVEPSHIGPSFPATGAAGAWLMATTVVAGKLWHPLTVAVTVYVPAAAPVTGVIVGFCNGSKAKQLLPVAYYFFYALLPGFDGNGLAYESF